jgi:hypothetical protein
MYQDWVVGQFPVSVNQDFLHLAIKPEQIVIRHRLSDSSSYPPRRTAFTLRLGQS